MSGREEPEPSEDGNGERSALARYVMAFALSVMGLAMGALLASEADDPPTYAPAIGAVAIAVWYGGAGPGLAAAAFSWAGILLLFVEPRGDLTSDDNGQLARWAASFGIALIVIGMSEVLRVGQRRASTAAARAVADLHALEALNKVAAALAASVSTSDVAQVLTLHGTKLVGADGAVVGVVEGEDLVLEQPSGVASRVSGGVDRIPLQRSTLLTRAVREGAPIRADDRSVLALEYPDTVALLPSIGSGIAVPLWAGNEVVGTFGFVFEREGAIGDEQVAYTTTMARLAEQALERARLYERERDTRLALDRILQVAPRFRSEKPADVVGAICQEARTTFGADHCLLWRVDGTELELMAVDPPRRDPELGARLPIEAFPGLEAALGESGISFVPDVLAEATGAEVELVRRLGTRSSLRASILLEGKAELVVSLAWQIVVSEPDRSTLAIVRRFADQAALALEELERRRAEAEVARRADEMRRLQSLTASLSNAITRADVGRVAVDHLRSAVRADGGALAVGDEGQPLTVVAASGYSDEELEGWRELLREDATPAASALRRGDVAMYESVEAVRARFPGLEPGALPPGHTSFLYVPTVAGRRRNGLFTLSWSHPPQLTPDDLGYARSLASQVAQALDRATHFESERSIAETLQRSVLPASLPRVHGLQLAARYLPGSADLDVGGDWFDAVNLPDGRIGLVVGDVVGKGVLAAASMGQLRNALRAFSVDRLKPASVLARLNRLAEEVLDTTFATVVYVVVDPETGVCRIASAGHPPPVVRLPDGDVELLEGARGLPLGTGLDASYRQDVVPLPAGSTLVLYSDGLVERRGSSIDDGLRKLCDAVRSGPSAPERMLDHVLEELVGEGERGDDIVVLTARLLPVAPRALHLTIRDDPGSLELVRDALRVWLEGLPLERSDAEDIVLAAWEACANAREHAREPTDSMVHLHASVTKESVRIVVQDSGRWKAPTASSDRGLGLRLMRSLMSSVDVAVGDDGTRVTIEKALAGARDP